ncbi:tRNA (adenosine(37)-N6)-threonylcarbamoyltransferase complex dimerization subunit type 1 TsaB [Blattabacterium cuenoti]|uniref:tRNA (adenosine(37)-N6)-threonylcarbamoyltransferase complex dimerization subunit type 1 TsaB n=1 Tax=Blattabacterium cuenoti TaxID=1653831 RepID=UPI00163CA7BA|nr:tRNA (adenosine(37)-N6)-threonylcarbamoyltransferase complex dimerization subunit type 1 TsaB [Blattabacterium cuenoti]
MSLILNLETSTNNCSVSIAKNGKCLAYIEEHSEQYLHSEKLHNFIQYILDISNINIKKLDSVCVSKGPGSYSSLRIGSSSAKGFCISLGIPMLTMNSLTILVQEINIKNGFIIPMIYAKKGFFYTSLYNNFKKRINSISINKYEKSFFQITKNHENIYYIGNINFPENNVSLLQKKYFFSNFPSAKNMAAISYIKFCKKEFIDLEKYIPIYL